MINGELITLVELRNLWNENYMKISFYLGPDQEVVTSKPWKSIKGTRIMTLGDLVAHARKKPIPAKGGWKNGRKGYTPPADEAEPSVVAVDPE